MKLTTSMVISFLFFAFFTGCLSRHSERETLKDQVDIFGVQLYSNVDYLEIKGVRAVEEPCIRGYERNFDALDIIIGYGFDRKVRKITTRNPNTSLFGIRPGMTYGEGKQLILQNGFNGYTPPFIFRSKSCSVTFLVDDKDKIFALKLESLD